MILSNNNLFNLGDIIHNIEIDGYKGFIDFAEDMIKTHDDGQLIDMLMPMYAINIIKYPELSGFSDDKMFKIKLNNYQDYIKMAKKSNGNFLDVFHGGLYAVYNDFEYFPFARVYYYQLRNEQEFNSAFDKRKELKILPDVTKLLNLLDVENLQERKKQYLDYVDNRFEKLVRYLNGRSENTSLRGGIAITRHDYICPICNSNEVTEIETIAITNFESGLQVSMEVCKKCLSSEAKNNILLRSIFQKMDIPSILQTRKLEIEEIREISKVVLKIYLNADIQNIDAVNMDTFTVICIGGYILKLRLTDIDDYGYIILSPDQKELVRFDSAMHHSDKVEFMPHHVHNNLPEEEQIKKKAKKLNKKRKKELKNSIDITDSFLTGFLGIDYVALKKKLLFLESKGIK